MKANSQKQRCLALRFILKLSYSELGIGFSPLQLDELFYGIGKEDMFCQY